MRRVILIFGILLIAHATRAALIPQAAQTSRVVDRIVARIEGDIILESQVRELGAFQELIEGRAESDDQLLSELIEQWVVQTEAAASHFPEPAQTEVERELARLTDRFGSPDAYASKLRALDLSATQARQLLSRQIYIERYLDYKFRSTVQIETTAIHAYYENQFLPELAKNNQPAPREADVQEQVRELLVQKAISELTAKWLDETKSRLKIERTPPDPKP
jgi:hypothetical protein